MTYPPSIAVYHEACDEIRSWMTDWISSHDFDRLSAKHRPQQKRIVAYTGETILMPFFGGDPNLALLKEMLRAQIVKAKKVKGVIYYKEAAE